MTRLIDVLARLNEAVSVAARNFAGGLVMAMTLIVLLQVFFRYVVNDSLTWTEELAKIMMVWSAFLVAPWAYRMGANVSIDLFAEALPEGLRRALQLLLNALVLWIVAVFFQESLEFWQRGLAIRAATIPLAMAWFYSIVPVGFAAIFLVGCELVLRNLMTLLDPRQDWAVPGAGTVQEGE